MSAIKLVTASDGYPTTAEMRNRVVEALREADFGTLATYAELTKLLGRDPREDDRARKAILTARRRLLKESRRLLICEPKVGYRVAEPFQHADYSERRRAASGRRLRDGLLAMTYLVLERLSPAEQTRALGEQVRLGIAIATHRRVTHAKTLPDLAQLARPSTKTLLALFTKRKASGDQ